MLRRLFTAALSVYLASFSYGVLADDAKQVKAISATASSIQNDSNDFRPENAIDENSVSRWSSKWTDSEWISIDLGSEKNVTGVELLWEPAFGKEFKIQASTDGKAWTDAFVQTDGKGGSERINFEKPQTARYLKMLGIKRATTYGYSLYEFRCFAKEPVDAEVALVVASSTQDDSDALKAENAIDGDMKTRWSSKWNDDEWICLDLGSEKDIAGVVLLWEGAFGKEYKIQVSKDISSWTDAFVQDNGKGAREDINFSKPMKARYVRMFGIKRATTYGYSLYEFKVKLK